MNIFAMKRLILICVLGLGLLAFAGMRPAHATAAPLRQASCTLPATVTTADELYDCIIAANAGSGGTITLGADINLTALTTSPLPQVSVEITLEGDGYTIDGGGSVQIFDVGATAGVTGNLTINQATLQNGSATDGGAIYNQGVVTMTGSTISGSKVSNLGGGIANYGDLTVTNSTFTGNEASNLGGGIYNGGTLNVTSSTFSGNTAARGGGLALESNGPVELGNVTISGNTGTSGGGIWLADNAALTAVNVTITANTATGQDGGGGIHTAVPLQGTGLVTLSNTIVADQALGPDCATEPDTNLAVVSADYNLDSDDTCNLIQTNDKSGNLNANLLPLGNNGGLTQTHALAANSDAIDMANNGVCAADPVNNIDQRGVARPYNGVCDIGAYEFGSGQLTIAKETDPAGGTDFPFTIDPGAYSFDFKWGSQGSGDGEFSSPRSVAVDAAGNIYVADTSNARIQKFDSNGGYLSQWGSNGTGDGQFAGPVGVAVDADGNVYVVDNSNHRIQKFDNSGAFLFLWGWDVVAGNAETGFEVCTPADTCQAGNSGSGDGQFKFPWGVAIDDAGSVYVADTNNDRIQKFDSNGVYLTQWGSNGSGDGQFKFPYDVAVDAAGNVYVADRDNDRIQKFDSSGGYLSQWGSSGTSDGQFDGPGGVAVDAAGNVYVADTTSDRIQKFDSNGVYLAQWGSFGASDGQFKLPYSVAVSASGNVYVADTFNNRIQVFNPDLSTVLDDGQGDSFYLAPGTYLVSELVPDGWTLDQIDCGGSIVTGQTTTEVTLEAGDDITCTFNNTKLATLTIAKETDPAGGTDFPFTIDPGTYSFDFQWGSTGNGDGQFDEPRGVAIDSAGNVYVSDHKNNRIQKFDSSGNYLTQWGAFGTGDGQFNSPRGIAIDAADNIYVADVYNSRIQKFDSSGAFLAKWGSYGTGNGQFDTPQGVAVDPAGKVYVVDSSNDNIQKFDSSGAFLAKWGSTGSGDGQFDVPIDVIVDAAGNVYVVDFRNDRVQKFDSSGAFLTKWGSIGSGDGEFNQPISVAVDAAGNVYVADFFNDRIQKFDSSGAYLTQRSLGYPFSVAVDAAGSVYVANLNNRIQVFNPDLSTTLDDGQSDSFDLAPGTYLVSELVPDGWTVTAIDCGGGIVTGQTTTEVTLEAGDAITCTFNNTKLATLTIAKETDPAGGTDFPFTIDPGAYSFDFKWGSQGSGDGQFDSPHGVAVDFAGNVYVADTANHRIQKFDSSGAFLTQWGSQGSGDGQFESPNGVAVDATGNVYVADTANHRIQKFDSSGAFLFMWGWDVVAGNAETGLEVCTPADTCQGGSFGSSNGQLDQPRGVAVDFAGNVYVTSIFNNRIEKFDSSGAFLFSWGWDVVAGNTETGFEVCTPADACQQGSFGSGDGQFKYTTGVAVDTAGNIYVNDLLNSRIQKFDSSGAFLTKWGSFGSGDGQFRLAYGVAVDAAGNVYLADFVNNRIQKFDSSGAFLTKWGSSDSGDGQFNRPNGVAIDAAGSVYVADKDNNRIQVFNPDLSHYP